MSHQLLRWSNLWIPSFLRSPIYSLYAKKYNANLEEAELPLHKYSTFRDFFIRKLNRAVPEEVPNTISSPCDGRVLSYE